ncbi:hypothetical protein FB45DRAFT_1029790 [Roridomyces roridus]|uniref:Ribonuclease H1 N-terminal domain-containing protein n=1 Tax=Roridomyces roridus TaxID=1738132 RepID=A0AAD7BQC9_9AGAR|nr:hypothetical protein FB45DRAFT_1029790 [Roridomyces roridus]
MTDTSAAATTAATPAEELAALVASLRLLSADALHVSNRCVYIANTLPFVVTAQVNAAVAQSLDDLVDNVNFAVPTPTESESDSDSDFGDAHSTTSAPDSLSSDAPVVIGAPAVAAAPGAAAATIFIPLGFREGIAPTPDEVENRHPPGSDDLQYWYTICVGRNPGIYSSPDMAEAQVRGVPHANRKRKDSKMEALNWYRYMHGLGQVYSINEVYPEILLGGPTPRGSSSTFVYDGIYILGR